MGTLTDNGRMPPGQVRDAIISFLTARNGQASIDEIRQGAANLLKARLAASSVRSYLRLNTPGVFDRVNKGHYRLASAADAGAEVSCLPAFEFGKARLYGVECISWLSQQEPATIHAVVTDPPYGLVEYTPAEQTKLRNGRGGVWRIPPSFDGHKRSPLPRFTVLSSEDHAQLSDFFYAWATALYPVLVPGAHVVVATNPLLSHLVASAVANAGFEKRGEIVRLTMTMRGGDRPKNAHEEFRDVSVMMRSMWEPWVVFRKPIEGRVQDNLRKWQTGGFRRPSDDKPFGDVIVSSPTRARERAIAPHPSLKPQAFLRQIVRAVLPLGQGVVLDPFAGSGSTLAAAQAVGYASVGLEIDPHYVELARQAIPRLSALDCGAGKPNSAAVSQSHGGRGLLF